MSDQYIGEIRIVPFDYAPKGWAYCDGRLLPIQQYTALFALIGTTYGGNGTSNFALPNYLSNVPISHGQGPGLTRREMGEAAGTSQVTLTTSELPPHMHSILGDISGASTTDPTGAYPSIAQTSDPRNPGNLYASAPSNVEMQSGAVLPVGGSQPHNNMQPYLALNFIIALSGVYPARG